MSLVKFIAAWMFSLSTAVAKYPPSRNILNFLAGT